jgi:hypothetical protein
MTMLDLKKKVMAKKKDQLFSYSRKSSDKNNLTTNSSTGEFGNDNTSSGALRVRGVTTDFKNLSKLTKK